MKKLLTCIILYALTALSPALAEHHATQHSPAIGVHGMAIFKVNESFYASHMPLANSIHAHQVIFSFTLDDSKVEPLSTLLSQHELVSIVPEVFDLWDLMNGSLSHINVDIHINHFERGGELVRENIRLEIGDLSLATPLENNVNGQYYVVPIDSESGLLVHKIGPSPSFDQILQIKLLTDDLLSQKSNKQAFIELGEGKPINSTVDLPEDSGFIITKQLYLETRDFQ